MIPNHGDLTKWAKQGVLLLNNVLTVEEGRANSHSGKGWETFTLNIVKALNKRQKPLVFILWGNNARAKKTIYRHFTSFGFRECAPFSTISTSGILWFTSF